MFIRRQSVRFVQKCINASSLTGCQVINFYLNLVMARTEQDVGGRKVYCFSTFFFPKLHSGGHAAVRRWTKSVDLFLNDIILIPLHLGVHWSLAVSQLLTFSGLYKRFTEKRYTVVY